MLREKWVAMFVIASFLSSFMSTKTSAATLFQAEKFPFKEMQVQVMPEFDYPEDWGSRDVPSLLVGEYGTITNKSGQDYDGKIEIPIPAMEKGFEANLVAEFPDKNKPEVQRPYDVDKEKGIVSWKPAKAIKKNETYQFVIEYYTKTIDVKEQKSFTYQLINNAEIDQLDVIFYSPMAAKNIKLEPKTANSTKSEYGEELYYYQYKGVKAKENPKYSFSYQKNGTESTMEAINKQQASTDNSGSTATDQVKKDTSSSSTKQPLIGVGGATIIGLAILLAGIFVYLGLKGKAQGGQRSVPKGTKQKQQPLKQSVEKKDHKSSNTEEKKELRKKLLTGKIDQEMYEEEMKKLI
jgi:hypothetical protein